MSYKTIQDFSKHVHTMHNELRLYKMNKNLLYFACFAHT